LSRCESESCWILHRRPWRESSLLVELFSCEQGRIGLVARGLRRQSSPWRGLGEPFIPLRAAWVRRGELGTLTDVEAMGSRVVLSGQALWCGLYANELILTLLGRDDPAPGLFRAYSELLPSLPMESGRHAALRRFELALLDCLGVAPDLTSEALQGAPLQPQAWYRLDPEAGFVAAAPGPGVYSGRAILSLGLASGSESGADADVRRQAREIMRVLIDHQLDGRPLRTRELFRSVR